ncbi:PREDICTED: uncharacterized protein LOC104759862 [Camelina sativa]|uniref:Uncharacterized protein LOC104759862 n=1 Tax=Camelina sativa TaxID=90675 RepID=A0ABM0X5J4_CAMSA|nr:PREDICTED: uncharacterized protein LOC104759862 [Camelina sativa]
MDPYDGVNRRRRSARRHQTNDRETNRSNDTTQAMIIGDDAHAYRDIDEYLSLSLGSKSYFSHQIPPVTAPSVTLIPSLRLAPPSPFSEPMKTTWETTTHDETIFPSSLANTSYSPYLMTPPMSLLPPSSWLSRSQGSFPSPIPPPPMTVDRFSFVLPPNLTAQEMGPPMMMTNSAPPPVRNPIPQPAVNQSEKSETIPPPFPWATNIRGEIHTLEYLESKEITTITGEVQCRYCEQVYEMSYDLREKFAAVEKIFVMMKRIMRERAPQMWTNPEQRRCELCGRDKAVKPVIAERKSQINWLFLLMGQTLGYCTLEQLKNFCKHSKSHRTGAKDRVLYLTYLGLCKMLDPNNDLFDRADSGSRR